MMMIIILIIIIIITITNNDNNNYNSATNSIPVFWSSYFRFLQVNLDSYFAITGRYFVCPWNPQTLFQHQRPHLLIYRIYYTIASADFEPLHYAAIVLVNFGR